MFNAWICVCECEIKIIQCVGNYYSYGVCVTYGRMVFECLPRYRTALKYNDFLYKKFWGIKIALTFST